MKWSLFFCPSFFVAQVEWSLIFCGSGGLELFSPFFHPTKLSHSVRNNVQLRLKKKKVVCWTNQRKPHKLARATILNSACLGWIKDSFWQTCKRWKPLHLSLKLCFFIWTSLHWTGKDLGQHHLGSSWLTIYRKLILLDILAQKIFPYMIFDQRIGLEYIHMSLLYVII